MDNPLDLSKYASIDLTEYASIDLTKKQLLTILIALEEIRRRLKINYEKKKLSEEAYGELLLDTLLIINTIKQKIEEPNK
jgi:hypothetical protein